MDTRSAGHWADSTITDAVHLDVYPYFIRESSEEGIRSMVAGLHAAFRKIGADKASRVIFFEDATGMISPRAFWFYELCGYRNGVVLDGGLSDWKAVGGKVAQGHGISVGIEDGCPQTVEMLHRNLIFSLPEICSRGGSDILIDTRDPDEWAGTFAHDCCARAGRIPESEYLFYEDILHNGRFRKPEEIKKIAARLGLSLDKNPVLYCHRGARAATVYCALKLIGFEQLAIYTGGWHEWANHPDLPTAPLV